MAPLPLLSSIERLNDTRRRIHRVIDFIDENLEREMRLADLADIACISRFHFQRVYGRMVGQTPIETIRYLRLLRARDRIVLDGASQTEAARAAGFRSVPPFARAYRRQFDRSPAEIRLTVGLMPRPQPLGKFTIVERHAQQMIATSYAGERAAMDAILVDTQAYAKYLTGAENAKAVAVYHDDFLTPYDQVFRCDLCVPLTGREPSTAIGSFATVVVPGGLYACVEQRGLLFDLAPHWEKFAGETLLTSGWHRRPGPVLRSFVSDRAVTPPSQRLAYLYIPVERAVSH